MIHRLHHCGRQGIKTLADLQEHLQVALEIEHATVPPYLCALYSLEAGANFEVAAILRSVVMEEMLHMALVANLLNALGGRPSVTHKGFIPEYPTTLPHGDHSFEVHLCRFSPEAIETFLKIERPAGRKAPPEAHHYHTIGQFYDAIEKGLEKLCRGPAHYRHRRDCQLGPGEYYGGGGRLFVIDDFDSARRAIAEIRDQGEGHGGIFDHDVEYFGEGKEPAHYYRFLEIKLGRRFVAGDRPDRAPTGPELPVSWDQVHPMRQDPRANAYAQGTEIRRQMDAFNRLYSRLLAQLQAAFDGQKGALGVAANVMFELKYAATALMKVPSGDGSRTVGPSFEFLGD